MGRDLYPGLVQHRKSSRPTPPRPVPLLARFFPIAPTGSYVAHLLGGVTHDAAEERLLEVWDDLAGTNHHSPDRNHLIDMLGIQAPQRLHLPQVVCTDLFNRSVEVISRRYSGDVGSILFEWACE